jgi:hypothetical protein
MLPVYSVTHVPGCSSAGLEPFPEGALCLAGRAAGKKAGNADVFVQIKPVDTFAAPDQAPVRTLPCCPISKTWVPEQRDAHGSAVDKVDD